MLCILYFISHIIYFILTSHMTYYLLCTICYTTKLIKFKPVRTGGGAMPKPCLTGSSDAPSPSPALDGTLEKDGPNPKNL